MDSDILWPQKPAWQKSKLVAKLRRALKGRVDNAYLFGSYARGDATDDSDIDLMLVASTAHAWPDRCRPFGDLWRDFGAVDLLVYRPDEWALMLAKSTPFFEKAKAEWVRIV